MDESWIAGKAVSTLLRSWKLLLFEGFDMSDTHFSFDTSETQFRNCENCVQTLLFLWTCLSSLVRGNEREKTVWTPYFTLLKADAFWRFWHMRDAISKLRKLCSDIALSWNLPQFSSSSEREKTVWNPYFTLLKAASFWRFWHIKDTFSKLQEIASRHYSSF